MIYVMAIYGHKNYGNAMGVAREAMKVLGIDPGENTGFASYEDGKLVDLWTLNPLDAIGYLSRTREEKQENILFIMEDSRLQTVNYLGIKENKSVIFTIGRRVVTVDGLCALYEAAIGKNKLIKLSPLQKGSKLGADYFKSMTGWDGKTNQHCRDAATVSWQFRNYKP